MRTTVDLPPATHRRATELARRRGMSLSRVLAELTADALDRLSDEEELSSDPRTGAPVVYLGTTTTALDVATLWDEE